MGTGKAALHANTNFGGPSLLSRRSKCARAAGDECELADLIELRNVVRVG